jgi:hypothetical protein
MCFGISVSKDLNLNPTYIKSKNQNREVSGLNFSFSCLVHNQIFPFLLVFLSSFNNDPMDSLSKADWIYYKLELAKSMGRWVSHPPSQGRSYNSSSRRYVVCRSPTPTTRTSSSRAVTGSIGRDESSTTTGQGTLVCCRCKIGQNPSLPQTTDTRNLEDTHWHARTLFRCGAVFAGRMWWGGVLAGCQPTNHGLRVSIIWLGSKLMNPTCWFGNTPASQHGTRLNPTCRHSFFCLYVLTRPDRRNLEAAMCAVRVIR